MKIVEKVIALEEEQGATTTAPAEGAAEAPAASAKSTSKRPAKRAKSASSSAAAKRDIPPRPARSAKKR
jgi:hypothetical protein